MTSPCDARRRRGPASPPRSPPATARPLRVLVVDDHLLVRCRTRRQLEEIPNLQVVGEAVDGFEAVALARTLSPDLVLHGHLHAGARRPRSHPAHHGGVSPRARHHAFLLRGGVLRKAAPWLRVLHGLFGQRGEHPAPRRSHPTSLRQPLVCRPWSLNRAGRRAVRHDRGRSCRAGSAWKPRFQAGESRLRAKSLAWAGSPGGRTKDEAALVRLFSRSSVPGVACQYSLSHLPTQMFRSTTLFSGGTPLKAAPVDGRAARAGRSTGRGT